MRKWATTVGLLMLALSTGCQTLQPKSKSMANLDPSVPGPVRPSADVAPHLVTAPPPTGRYHPHLLDGGQSSRDCNIGIRGAGRG